MKILRRIAGVLLIVHLIFIVSFMVRKQARVRSNQENQSTSEAKPTSLPNGKNHLANEKSPYLLQHADNPVDWYPWSDEAFAKAKKENKPIFLSIGYSTCHWCHVMEHESFENEEIAKIMNQYFVPIKVDREERPDIDNIYMKAVQMMTGSGGWPLSIFMTPDKKPFYGGTYFPPESRWGRQGLKEMLSSIGSQWQHDPKNYEKESEALLHSLKKDYHSWFAGKYEINERTLITARGVFIQSFDNQHGGFGRSQKFPLGHNLSFLLRYWLRKNDARSLEMVEKTLQEMSRGGIYDHLGGGIHRYSTDRLWRIPHFEKMLYDQAIIARSYLEAYLATGKEEYAQTARAIFDYVLRDLSDAEGGFYSAEDADSFPPEDFKDMSPDPSQRQLKKEGAFYLWSYDELTEILDQDPLNIFAYHYGVKPNGNIYSDPHGEFGKSNILYIKNDIQATANHFKRSKQEITSILNQARAKLLEVRSMRPRPHLDDKILTDWNGLMISSLAFGSRVLVDPKYSNAAEQSADFILEHLVRIDGRLLHRYRDNDAAILGTIEDYAFFIHGLIDLYQATFKEKYLKEAKRLTNEMNRLFWDKENKGFYFTAIDAEKLLIREKEIYDGAIPSGNSVAALDLIRLALMTMETDWEKKAEELFNVFSQSLSGQSSSYGQMLIAVDFALGPSKEIVIAGQRNGVDVNKMIEALYSDFLPNIVVTFRPANDVEAEAIIELVPFVKNQKSYQGRATAFVCENYQCKKPTWDINEFKALIY